MLELVRGKPREDILGLPHTPEGYEEAKKILQNTYGKDIKVRKALIQELEELGRITNTNHLKEIHEFYNKLARIVRTLVTMKKLETAQSHVYSLMDKLGPVKEALATKDDDWEEWDLEQLVENLRRYIDRHPLPAERGQVNNSIPFRRRLSESRQEWKGKERILLASAAQKNLRNACVYCERNNHRSSDCFKVLDIAQRKNILRSKNMCFICTNTGHLAAMCKSRGCFNCGGRHHTSLCDSISEKATAALPNQAHEKGMRAKEEKTTIHATLMAKVNGIDARIMLDSGAGSSYICTSLLRKLGIRPLKTERRVIEQMYGTVIKQVQLYKVTVTSNVIDGFSMELKCINGEKDVLTYLTNPCISELKRRYWKLQRLQFSDEEEKGSSLPVHIILGAADYQRIKTAEPAVLGPDPNKDPGAEFTKLGWTLSGMAVQKDPQSEKTFFAKSAKDEFDQMCSLEVLGLKDDNMEGFHNDFMDKLQRLPDGTYMTRLPWKESAALLPTNKPLAVARLRSTTKKLERLGRLQEYDQVMQEQLDQGIIERIPEKPTGDAVHWIPHQPVIRDDAESTKMRIVYDCSAKANVQEPSLNDLLETGPSLQPLLFDILLKNRMHRYCITGDVQKAFLQIKIHPEDRDAQRLLWYDDLEKKTISEFRFSRVIFGSAPSPYILGATLNKHLSQYEEKYPKTVESLQRNTYVDDVQCSADSVEELLRFKEQSTTIMAEGGFKLHKWHSNVQAAEQQETYTPDNGEETYAKVTIGATDGGTKILGIPWNKVSDTFDINFERCVERSEGEVLTKRKMLSAINGIFDPLGITAPVVLIGKILYSEVCLLKVSWDDKLPKEIVDRWVNWIKMMKSCSTFSIPRSVTNGMTSKMVIHGFSDASKKAIASAVYLVTYYGDMDPQSKLLVAKSRIAPKDTTIPRLELIGAHMLCRLLSHVRDTLADYPINEIHGWVDSTTVLFWLRDQGRWTQFVRNRTRAIQEKDFIMWRYVPTEQNPADMGSRGVSPLKLGENWTEGPGWLSDKDQWPEQPEIQESQEILKEKVACKEKQMLAKETTVNDFESMLQKHSHWKVMRITAYVMRFLRHCRKEGKAENNIITAKEIEAAENFWIRKAQETIGETKDFQLKRDDEGILLCDSRIPNYNPILLPRAHQLTKLIVNASHRRVLHYGVSATMADVRERFWVPQLRSLVKKIIRNCNRCKRFAAKPLSPPEKSLLPEFRVEFAEPFAVTGVDFAGPIIYKEGKQKTGKAYIALFTCASTRAVYLKLCKDMTAEEFKRAFKEFAARRGKPRLMISDNAKTFIATKKWLKKLKKDPNLLNYLAEHKIDWRFNMSRAPWWGGFFERLIGIMKRSLSKMIGRGMLRLHELEEVLLDVECTMNNRPLCYQGEELEQPVITPNILIRGGPAVVLQEDIEMFDLQEKSTKRLVYMKRTKEMLRKRWMGEYLKALEERRRKHCKGTSAIPMKGAIVLLKEDCKNKAFWKIGRIIKHIQGADGVIRGIKLKLGNGYIVERPLQLVCDLEIGGEIEKKQLDPEAPAFKPNEEQDSLEVRHNQRKAKAIARDQIVGVALQEEDEEE